MNILRISKTADNLLKTHLSSIGFNVDIVDNPQTTYYPVSTHADIFSCQLGIWKEPEIFIGNADEIKDSYPGNIIYNAVCTEEFFIHNFKYTDEKLMTAVKNRYAIHGLSDSVKYVNVSQGYTRCVCLPVNDNSFITADEGVAVALESAGANVLRIRKGHILLPEFDYGFIGGCAGHLNISGKPTIIFNGNLENHPDFDIMSSFIRSKEIDIFYYKDYPLTDIGSILYGKILYGK